MPHEQFASINIHSSALDIRTVPSAVVNILIIYMYVCMYVCIYVCMYVCMYV